MIYSTRHLEETEYLQVTGKYYARRSEWAVMKTVARHVDFCRCVSKRRKDLLFCGQSACAILKIPRLDSYEMRPNCISDKRRSDDDIHWHYGPRDPNALVIDDTLVTSPIWTICDLAKTDTSESLLVSLNHCLNKKMFTKKQLLKELETRPVNMPGKNLLRRLLRFATHKCESPLDTLAWIKIYKAGHVLPQQQVGIRGANGFYARADMFWKLSGNRQLILELDGMLKYKEEGSLGIEKIREDQLRKMGYEVIRATWPDVVKSSNLLSALTDRKVPIRRDFKGTFPKT
jgi:very-short-patch-repair endonuclease